MNKKLFWILLFVVLASLVLVSVVSAKSKLVRLEVINKTDEPVYLSLVGTRHYYLTVAKGTTKTFTVEREIYKHTTYSCSKSQSGTVDITTQLRMVFTSCYQTAPNWGAPSQEKIHITDSPDGIYWYYQH